MGEGLEGTVDLFINNEKEHFTVKVKKEFRDYQLPKLVYYNRL